MKKHESKTCPNCTHTFECKTNNIQTCQCETVDLTQAQRDYIATQFDDCLCAECLNDLRTEFNINQFQAHMKKLMLGERSELDGGF